MPWKLKKNDQFMVNVEIVRKEVRKKRENRDFTKYNKWKEKEEKEWKRSHIGKELRGLHQSKRKEIKRKQKIISQGKVGKQFWSRFFLSPWNLREFQLYHGIGVPLELVWSFIFCGLR